MQASAMEEASSTHANEALKEQRLKNEKLEHEIASLRRDLTRLGLFSKYFWPMLMSGITVGISLVAILVSLWGNFEQRERQHRQDVARLLSDNLSAATDDKYKPTRRIAAIWALGALWEYDEHWQILANTLSAILVVDEDPRIRDAAAQVIGLAIRPETTSRNEKLAKLLYGSSTSWEAGTVVVHHWALQRDTSAPAREERLFATREAIRMNWECLRGVHLGGADLHGIVLRKADLRGAYLGRSNLTGADLRGTYLGKANLVEADLMGADLQNASLDGARFVGAIVRHANIDGIKGTPQEPPSFRTWALENKAVEMESAAFDRWRKAGYIAPGDWTHWAESKFLVDPSGRPIER